MNMKKKKKNSENWAQEFEFCKVCKLNHNQGRKHMYLPHHKKSLSNLLSRFESKLYDVRLLSKNPTPLRATHASRNRLWCIFCDLDILELDCGFACGNAIAHFASGEHLKNVKAFLWKHGGGMDRVDAFCISDDHFSKWQIKCELSNTEVAGEESQLMLIGPTNDIHYLNTIGMSNFNSISRNISNDVLPLQKFTNERSQLSKPGIGSESHNMRLSTDAHVPENSAGLQNLTRISLAGEYTKGNVHSGAPPPWFNETEDRSQLDKLLKPGRSSKLNPKRVGAAWAERRKIELELERKEEVNTNNTYDANWLPNFGGVWQSGSRKESRKAFQIDQKTSLQDETQSPQLQPYISKQKRPDISQ